MSRGRALVAVAPALLAVLAAALGGGRAAPPHHAENGFANPWPEAKRNFGAFLKWRLGLGPPEPSPFSGPEDAVFAPETAEPDLALIGDPDPEAVQITWIGHSTVLVQMAGVNILTDPVFSDRVSPVSFAGPVRRSPPGLGFEQLPRIDLVLVSHDHYDHLDKPTIERLGPGIKYLVPLGLKKWFGGMGITSVRELDWWQGIVAGPLAVGCVPARHFSGRGPFRRDRTLWCGWLLSAGGLSVYFAGDTGYSPHFLEIRRRFGPVDAALLPIGAYRPRWFMEPVHLDPPQAVRAHAELGSRRSIPVHWGAFRQSAEPLGEPPLYLLACLEAAGLDTASFSAVKLGQTVTIRPEKGAGTGDVDLGR